MSRRDILKISFVASLCALGLLIVASAIALSSNPVSGQEQFEVISRPVDYTAQLTLVSEGLRRVLFVDGLFMVAYAVAIGFAVLAFADNNRAAAWLGGLGIVAVMVLDALENATMAQSLDIAAMGIQIPIERIAYQASISAMKWQFAAAALFAVSFVLPYGRPVEKLLVWGIRIGLPIAVPLFLTDAFALRQAGGLLLLLTMCGGFALLAWVVRTQTPRV